MIIVFSPRAVKQRNKLSKEIYKKFYKQLSFLLENPKHPSLRARKKSGSDSYEARIDDHYRFSYEVVGEEIIILVVGPHDVGLGKK